jgi:hypothetical protein
MRSIIADSKVIAWGTNETGQLCLPHKRIVRFTPFWPSLSLFRAANPGLDQF